MSLATHFANAWPTPPVPKLERIFRVLPQEDRDLLLKALNNPDMPNTVIARALTDAGHPIGAEAIRKARPERA